MNQKVLLKSLDKITLGLYLTFLKLVSKKLDIKKFSILKLPKKKKRITFLKSPHVNKKAQEHFELKVHKALLCFSKKDSFSKFILINKPQNINIKIQRE
jgi:ribosomal protein S10